MDGHILQVMTGDGIIVFHIETVKDNVSRCSCNSFWGATVLGQAFEDADTDAFGKAGRSWENVIEDGCMSGFIEPPDRRFFSRSLLGSWLGRGERIDDTECILSAWVQVLARDKDCSEDRCANLPFFYFTVIDLLPLVRSGKRDALSDTCPMQALLRFQRIFMIIGHRVKECTEGCGILAEPFFKFMVV